MTPRDEITQELFGLRWAEVEARMREFIEEAERRVATWAWVKSSDHLPEDHAAVVLEPLEIRKRKSDRQMGFDADGEIAVARYFDRVRDPEPSIVGIRHGSTVLRFVHGELTKVSHAEHDAGERLVRVRRWFRSEFSVWTYTWEGDRPQHYTIEQANGQRSRVDYEYDSHGLARLRAGDNVLWARRSPIPAAYANVLERLPGQIHAWAHRVAPAEPVCALILGFSIENSDPAPTLTLGTLPELPVIRAHESGTSFRWRVLSGVYFKLREGLPHDPRLTDDLVVLRQAWQQNLDDKEPQTLLQEVARRLRAMDWGALETTKPLAIVAIPDDVGDEVVEYARATMSAKEIKALLDLG
jgi:hypothetical protein